VGFFTDIAFWRRGLSTHLLFCNTSNGIFHFYDQIALLFGASLPAEEEASAIFRARVAASEPLRDELRLGIAPTCSALSRERMLEPSEWLEIIAKRLRDCPPKADLHLFGAPPDWEYLETLKTALVKRFGEGVAVVNHAGKTTLEESVRLLSGMSETLCIDSSLLHFSQLLGVRTVSYWGPTDPRTLVRPGAVERDETHYVKLPCSPCIHVANQPPCRGHNICMRLAANPAAAVPLNPPWVVH
jgi:ADP-heptose:LPS heptosyltransferase